MAVDGGASDRFIRVGHQGGYINHELVAIPADPNVVELCATSGQARRDVNGVDTTGTLLCDQLCRFVPGLLGERTNHLIYTM